jgi:NADP-dependent 3-hydroxy acid dehydrogenase YdfG
MHSPKLHIASGIGLAVAADLSKSGKWQVNIIGTHQERGQEVADSLPNTAFYQADVRVYEQLAFVFDQIFERNDRLDFVFANAGRAEPTDFYKEQPVTCIPSKPDLECVDVNLNGALYTSHLAMHYFRRSPESTKRDRNLIFTSSIGGLYPCELIPVYVATKRKLNESESANSCRSSKLIVL